MTAGVRVVGGQLSLTLELSMTSPPRVARDHDSVVVHGDDVRVARLASDLPPAEARQRFGGLDLPACLGGVLTALGTLVLVSGLLAALGTVGYQQGLRDRDTLSLAGLGAGLLALVLTGLVGGWSAGRMSRYDGGRNGLTAAVGLAVLTLLLGALAGLAGDRFDLADRANLPTWVTGGATGARSAITGLVALAGLLASGYLGGRRGARWHREPDAALAGTRAGGLTPYPGTVAE
jgi:hypothetical protein